MSTENENPPEVATPKAEDAKAKSLAPTILKGDIKIFPDKRLPKFDQGDIKAYEAKGANGNILYALVGEKNIAPQLENVNKYTSITSGYLPKLVACSVAEWSVDFKEHLFFVYDDKLGQPVVAGKNPFAVGLKLELVISTIFRNILDVMHVMRDKGIAHGNIRATNIFDGGVSTFEGAMLGEMLSTPSGYAQPIIYETIQRGLANKLGRGPADISDDIYALGVTLAVLIRATDPGEGMSNEDVLISKMENSSFNFIVGKNRFPAAVLEFLRGTLNDEPELRWSLDDIMIWTEGRRVPAKNIASVSSLKATRPLEFVRHKYLKPQTLAASFKKDPQHVIPLVENGELYLWINRSLQDKELEERYDEAIAEAQSDASNSNYGDRLSSVMASALEPRNPVFYKGMSFLPTGFGSLLVNAVHTKKDIAPLVDILQSSIISFWNKCSGAQSPMMNEAISKLDNCQRFLKQSMMGYGIERCIYYLSPTAPCLSEKLDQYYVRSSEDFLNALESLSASKTRPEWFLDRHIAAFLSVRDKSVIEPFLPDLAATEKYRQRQGVIKMLATIQVRDKMGALPGVSQWLASMLDVLIDRYHDREKRRYVRDQLDKIKGQGNLEKIALLFENFEDIQKDMREYSETMRQFQALKKEHFMLEQELDTNKNFGIEAGRHAAAMVSGAVSVIVVTVYLLFTLMHSGGGGAF